jgi:hypothetical protein
MRRFALFAILLPLLAESVAGLKWTAPPGWKNDGVSRPMRAATYLISAAPGDPAGAECVVYFFGAGQGGSVEANLERWKGQMLTAAGQAADAKIAKRTVHGLTVSTIDSTGDYTGMGGPMASKSMAKGYRMLGAIIEGSGGNIFIKFAGPIKTVTANQPKFEQMVGSFDKEH